MESVLSKEWMVKPSECNALQELPLPLLVSQIIDLATDHANILGIGFLNLGPRGLGWVLSRLSVEMKRWPGNGESYTLSTWVETYNPHFSERCFSVTSQSGEILGYIRTIWMIIDLESHKSMGTSGTELPQGTITDKKCPIAKFSRHRQFIPEVESEYTFKYCDLDFYRHVNTVRYISLLLNQFTLEEFDTHLLSRFDIAFSHEAKYGETVLIKSIDESVPVSDFLPSGKYENARRRTFELSATDRNILIASIVLTK